MVAGGVDPAGVTDCIPACCHALLLGSVSARIEVEVSMIESPKNSSQESSEKPMEDDDVRSMQVLLADLEPEDWEDAANYEVGVDNDGNTNTPR